MVRQKRISSCWLVLSVKDKANNSPVFSPLVCSQHLNLRSCRQVLGTGASGNFSLGVMRHTARGTTMKNQRSWSAAKHSVGQSLSRDWHQPCGSWGSPYAGRSLPPWRQREGERSASSPTQFILQKPLPWLVTEAKPQSHSPWWPSLSLNRSSEGLVSCGVSWLATYYLPIMYPGPFFSVYTQS